MARVRAHVGPVGVSVGSRRRKRSSHTSPGVLFTITAIAIGSQHPQWVTIPVAVVVFFLGVALWAKPTSSSRKPPAG